MNTITLSFAPEIHCAADLSGNDLPTRFSGVAYSGGLIPQFGGMGDTAIDLATLQASDRLFMLVNHNPDQRAGHGRVWVDNGQLHVEGQFAQSTEAGRQIAAEFRDGAPWQLSVGLQYQVAQPKHPIAINGQTLSVKTLLMHGSIREVSFVPVGADPHTSVAAFSATESTTEIDMSAELEAKINDLQGQLSAAQSERAAEKAARETAETSLGEVKAAARMNSLKQYFVLLGRDYSDEAVKPYMDLPDAAIILMMADVQTVKPTLDPALAQQVATAGVSGPDMAQLSAKLLAQVAGKKE